MLREFDIIVVGGGHAGSEAAHAAAKLGLSTLLLTNSIDQIASMPCNPAIGGPAKSHLVKEIDALGGLMGLAADATYIQMKTLNSSKGPATRALRAQSDKKQYSRWVREYLEQIPNLTIYQSSAKSLLFDTNTNEKPRVIGIETSLDEKILAKSIILTAGTFLEGKTFTGHKFESAGRASEKPSLGLSPQVQGFGLTTGRLKTGTPPRIDKKTINFEELELAPGDKKLSHFSFLPNRPVRAQYPCYITRSNADTHDIILSNLDSSPMYSGVIAANGPRYCPSIEDKVVRFPHNPSHHFFLEPEGLDTCEMYLQGFSTSLPIELQWQLVRTLPGCKSAVITRPAYAVEYDYFPGIQFNHNLESKNISALFVAGQVLGTSGYEEAAAQGIMAGINAALKVLTDNDKSSFNNNYFNQRAYAYAHENSEFILGRETSYIATLIDDLVTKEINDPYRMLTSRSEYRLLLRQDNADKRLTNIGYKVGLVDDLRLKVFEKKEENIKKTRKFMTFAKLSQKNMPRDVQISGSNRITLEDMIRRPECSHLDLEQLDFNNLEQDTLEQCEKKGILVDKIYHAYEIETLIKYEGYINRQTAEIKQLEKRENMPIPSDFDYATCKILSLEARDKLAKIKPRTIGQASRVGGVTPNDITSLLIALEAQNKITV